MSGAANAHYLGIKAFSETDFTTDLKAIDVPPWCCMVKTIKSFRWPTPRYFLRSS